MAKVKLKDIASFSKGSQINGDDLIENGNYDYLNGGINPSGKWNEYNVNANSITISEGGNSCGYVNYMSSPFWCGAHCYYLFDVKCNVKYLYYALKSQQERIMKLRSGACMPNIKKNDIGNFEFEFDERTDIQLEIAATLDKVTALIDMHKRQLELLEELVKSRFVELFGDPVHNSLQLSVMPMTEVCEIIDGDRGKNYPKQEDFFEEEYCLFLNAKNVTKNGFDFTDCMFITKEKDEVLRKGKLVRGDVVLTTRGTLGNLAFYTDSVPFDNVRINSGMVILRMKKEVIDEVFFMEQFRMQVEDIKRSVASGSAQPQLPISMMNKINVIMPNLESQQAFSAFVTQTDKSKSSIQQSLAKLETLKKSLMQEYFG